MTGHADDIHAIFNDALEHASDEERARYLDEVCRDAPAVRERVEALLQAHFDPHNLLGQLTPVTLRTVDPPEMERPGTWIGPYHLVEQLGEGGMGVVFLARQEEPVARQVALKIIKPGTETRRVMERFDAERHALSVMDHPHVAKVLDAGSTPSGRPYFVMEWVQGVSITSYCDEHNLSIGQRLELFILVCQAVQHAHQKGVIHRDLKPSNILVTLCDGRPLPKVIDFGVAKAISQASLEKATFTQDGQIVGTPEYMSPEQAQSNSLVDTRSDVYSLGVVLYELLTGDTPLDRQRLRSSAWDEMMRVIREEEPPKPSTKLSSSDALPSVAAQRSIEPARLGALVRGELDWIVMKALDKDRSRRYESPSALARDIENHLHDQPVLAGPPSARYRFRKFARRNKRTLATLAAIALTMLGGTAASLYQAVRATRAERLAEARLQEVAVERDAARRAEREAEAAAAQAHRRLEQIERGNELLAGIFEDLDLNEIKSGSDPLEAVLARRLIDAAEQLDGESVGDPLAVAQLQRRLGSALLVFGHYRPASGLLEKSRATHAQLLSPHHADTLEIMARLAGGLGGLGETRAALELWKEMLALSREHLGAEHPTTLGSMRGLAEAYIKAGESRQALPLLEEVVRLQQATLGDDHVDTMLSVGSLAGWYESAGQLDQARSLRESLLHRQEATLGSDHPHTIATLNNLANCYWQAALHTQAIAMYEEALERIQARLGADHPKSLAINANLAVAHREAGDTATALVMCESILSDRSRVLGPDHPDTLESMHHLAVCYRDAGQSDKAIELFERIVDRRRVKLGPDHPHTLNSLNSLAVAYGCAGQSCKAEPILEETLRLSRDKLGPRHPQSLQTMSNLASCYSGLGKIDEAIALQEECLELFIAQLGADHPDSAYSMACLARNCLDAGRYSEAEKYARECLRIRREKMPDDWLTYNTMSLLGRSLAGQRAFADAEPLLLEGYEGMVARAASIPPVGKILITETLDAIIQLYKDWEKPEEAERWRGTRDRLDAAGSDD
jgi:eukaryotic-like serine/threonine-protein kinase